MGNTAVPEHGAAVKSGDRIRYRVSTANSNGASIPIFALPNTIVVESATHSRIASILKFLGRKRENPSPFKEIGGFVV